MPSESNSQKDTIEDLQRKVQELQNQIQLQHQPVVYTVPVIAPPEKEEILFKWHAPERIFVKKDKQWYWTAALIVLIITVILLILGEAILVGAVFSILFVLYVTTTVPPAVLEHSVTNLGIRTAGELYKWEQLENYWFSYRLNKEMLNIDTKLIAPKKLIFFFTQKDKLQLLELLKNKLPYKSPEASQGWMSKNSEGTYIPLNDIETSIAYNKRYQKDN